MVDKKSSHLEERNRTNIVWPPNDGRDDHVVHDCLLIRIGEEGGPGPLDHLSHFLWMKHEGINPPKHLLQNPRDTGAW